MTPEQMQERDDTIARYERHAVLAARERRTRDRATTPTARHLADRRVYKAIQRANQHFDHDRHTYTARYYSNT